MTGKTLHASKNGKRRLALLLGLLSLAVTPTFLLTSPPALAAHGGPVVQVDASAPPEEDRDGDHHFKTLQAALLGPPQPQPFDTLIVEPGRYAGPLEIAVEGLTVRSTGGADRTVIAGPVRISAPDVRLEGFSVEAGGASQALTVEARGAVIAKSRVAGAAVGILVVGTNGATLEELTVYNHTGDGLVVRDAWDVRVRESALRGNGGLGVLAERSQDLVIEGSTIAMNGLGGVWLKGVQQAHVTKNKVRDNGLIGVALEGTSGALLEGNTLLSSEAGILLLDAGDNVVRDNEILSQRAVGLILKNGAQGNRIEGNLIQGNQGPGAAGVRLSGSVAGNRLVGNRIMENGVGIVLTANGSGAPAGNLFQENEVARSDDVGVRVEAGSRRNRFQENRIYGNLEAGVTGAGEANVYSENEITGNGTSGVILEGASGAHLEGNRVYDNGAEGVRVARSYGALLSANEITDNVREGVLLLASENLRLLGNTVAGNGGSGLGAREVETLILADNRVRANREHGFRLTDARDLDLVRNQVEANGGGGVHLSGVHGADLESNRVTENLHYGLLVLDSEGISARRNFWGDRSGPAGAFAGAGNAVVGLPLAQVTPWLPAEPDDLVMSSVSALVIESPRGRRIQFDASDRLGLVLELYDLGRGAPGRSELISQGIVLAARYASAPEGAPPLEKGMTFYAVTVEGVDAGTAELTLIYAEEDQPPGIDPARLRIFLLDEGEWRPLAGRADPELRRVTGEIDVRELDGRLIGLGMLAPGERSRLDLPWGTDLLRLPPSWGLLLALSALVLAALYGAPRRRRLARRELPGTLRDLPLGLRGHRP